MLFDTLLSIQTQIKSTNEGELSTEDKVNNFRV